jgi:hypothetical protein
MLAPGAVLALLGLGVGFGLYREQLQTGPDNVTTILGLCGLVVAVGVLLVLLGRARPLVPMLAAATSLVVCLLLGAFVAHYGEGFDLQPTAGAIAHLQRTGAAVATDDGFKGQFGFLGRLERPIPDLPRVALPAWAAAHPGGYLITVEDELPTSVHGATVHRHRYRRHWLVIWRLDPVGGAPAAGTRVARPVAPA